MGQFIYKKSDKFKIQLESDQFRDISSPDKINSYLGKEGILAFDVYQEDDLIAFVMLRKFGEKSWFLWNFAVDKVYQNKGLGYLILRDLVKSLKTDYGAEILTTTYISGNIIAQKLYEKLGFLETSIVDEEDCHEVNMELKL